MMKKFYNHLWTNYKSKEYQFCKTCDMVMNSKNLKSRCMSPHEKEQAKNELTKEGKIHYVVGRPPYHRSSSICLKVEEIRKRDK